MTSDETPAASSEQVKALLEEIGILDRDNVEWEGGFRFRVEFDTLDWASPPETDDETFDTAVEKGQMLYGTPLPANVIQDPEDEMAVLVQLVGTAVETPAEEIAEDLATTYDRDPDDLRNAVV